MNPDPIAQYHAWLTEAAAHEPLEPTAACLATVDAEGRPRARMVLVKHADALGFRFFTNYESDKARELEGNPHAALCFFWRSLHRQVRVEGAVALLSGEESDAYFATRPRGSQLGAWASDQSRPVIDRDALLRRFTEVEERFRGGDVPRPAHWGGYLLAPRHIELWQGRENRFHDRWIYTPDGEGGWTIGRLQP